MEKRGYPLDLLPPDWQKRATEIPPDFTGKLKELPDGVHDASCPDSDSRRSVGLIAVKKGEVFALASRDIKTFLDKI